MLRSLMILSLLILGACGAQDFESRADRLVGGSRAELIDTLGQPDATDGTSLYYYVASDRGCAYAFTIGSAGRVLGWYRRGESCPRTA